MRKRARCPAALAHFYAAASASKYVDTAICPSHCRCSSLLPGRSNAVPPLVRPWSIIGTIMAVHGTEIHWLPAQEYRGARVLCRSMLFAAADRAVDEIEEHAAEVREQLRLERLAAHGR